MSETILTEECGHHCGKKDGYVGHCPCKECHGKPLVRGYENGEVKTP